MRILYPYLKPYRKELFLGPFFKLLEAIFELLLPIYMAKLIDEGIRLENWGRVKELSRHMLWFTVIGLVCVLICQYYAAVASQGFGTDLRNGVYQKIHRLSPTTLNRLSPSYMTTLMNNDINQLQLALAMLIRLVIRAPFLSIGSIVMAFYIDPKSALIFLTILPIFSLVLFFIIKKTVPMYRHVQTKLETLTASIDETYSGVRVIRAFNRQEKQTQQLHNVSDDLARAYTRVANVSALLNPLTLLLMNLGIALLIVNGKGQFQLGALQQGEVVALVNYMMQMLLALIVVSNLVVIFTKAAASKQRLTVLLEQEEEQNTDSVPENLASKSITGDIPIFEAKNLSFRYQEEGPTVLQSLDFTLKPKTFTGIIGPTGSGKSTLAAVLAQLYAPTEGTLMYQGHPIQNLHRPTLMQQIRLVPQKSNLVKGTVRENLLWGKAEATDDELWRALSLAEIKDEILSHPGQLDGDVAEFGRNFSGGQRQRLALARALVGKPSVLILDDTLSALDALTAQRVQHHLLTLTDTTIIMISQRLALMQEADWIMTMKHGKIIDQNKPEILETTSSFYQEIKQSQQGGDEA